jgi:hypothetical protein
MPYRRPATPDPSIEDEEAREIEAFAAARRRSRQRVFVATTMVGTGVACLALVALGGMLSVPIDPRASTACHPAAGARSPADDVRAVYPVLHACGRVRLP